MVVHINERLLCSLMHSHWHGAGQTKKGFDYYWAFETWKVPNKTDISFERVLARFPVY